MPSATNLQADLECQKRFLISFAAIAANCNAQNGLEGRFTIVAVPLWGKAFYFIGDFPYRISPVPPKRTFSKL